MKRESRCISMQASKERVTCLSPLCVLSYVRPVRRIGTEIRSGPVRSAVSDRSRTDLGPDRSAIHDKKNLKTSGSSRYVCCQSFSSIRRLGARKTPKNRNQKNRKLWTAVCPPRLAPIGLKLGQNAFQTIPDISFFDAEKQKNV